MSGDEYWLALEKHGSALSESDRLVAGHGRHFVGAAPYCCQLPPRTRGMNLNQELVKQECWWYRKYAPGDTVLKRLETEPREAKKGLWADPAHVPPWEWRKRTRSWDLYR